MWDQDNELKLGRTLRRGDSGVEVKRLQEWLTLSGHALQPDGRFGPATELAVCRYQTAQNLPRDGLVSPECFARLVEPMVRCLAPLPAPPGMKLPTLVHRYAQQHLASSPREVGGQNRGPWVRLYMNGREGVQWRWCAGFACFCLRQACLKLRVEPPIALSYSCDLLATSAKQRGCFVSGADVAARSHVEPGDFFLIRRDSDDWTHVGIVSSVYDEAFDTIEGNTNDEGSVEGGEVTMRTRSFDHRDFILLAGASQPVG